MAKVQREVPVTKWVDVLTCDDCGKDIDKLKTWAHTTVFATTGVYERDVCRECLGPNVALIGPRVGGK